MFRKLVITLAALFSTAALVFGQQLPALPNDPETKVGKLDNGMTYYIRHNDKPANRAEFYLATHVGALQETPDQDGLAHFLEHMCFNGTKNFPGKGILNWLESIGASFGGNVNAMTGVEQTIYLLNNIPLVRETVVDTCLLIMHDYSHFVTCDPVEIDKERGVILEEKRSRNNASWRTREKSSHYLYGDTKYATTTIIGSEENLKTFKPESLTNFYHTWYRPDMQALIVVGDVDVNEVEAKIKSIFADIPAAENPKQKDVIKIPDNDTPIVGVITDPETSNISYSIYWKSEPTPRELKNTQIAVLEDILKDVIGNVMNERLNDIAAASDSPFLSAGFGVGSICETSEVVMATVNCKEDKRSEAFEALLTEVERMRRYGLRDDEIQRAKQNVLTRYETAAKGAESRKNSEFVYPMVYNFFNNTPFMDPELEYQLASQIMQMLAPQVINQVVAELAGDKNMVVLYVAPEREGLPHPSEQEILSSISKVYSSDIARAEGEEVPEQFVNPSSIKKGKIKKTSEGLYSSKVLSLSNGMTVVLLPSDLEKDKVLFSITKKGGSSLLSDEQLYNIEDNIFSLYVQNSGVSQYSGTMVSKMIAGKNLSVSPYISTYSSGVNGSCSPKDLETALQVAYLYYTDPRFDAQEYNQGVEQIRSILPNLVLQPNYKLNKELYQTAFQGDRHILLSEQSLQKASLEGLESCYRQLFSGVNGAVMTIVGDFDEKAVIPMIQTYVASLPKGKTSDWSYRGDGLKSGRIENDFTATMQTPMVTVAQVYNLETPYSTQLSLEMEALSYILDMVYVETLREDEGGTYGASSYADASKAPHEAISLQVVFQTNEEQADRLRELCVEGIEKIAKQGVSAEQFDKAKKNLEKNLPESKQRISYWASVLKNHALYGEDALSEYEKALQNLSAEGVQRAAKRLVESGNFIELVMRPQK